MYSKWAYSWCIVDVVGWASLVNQTHSLPQYWMHHQHGKGGSVHSGRYACFRLARETRLTTATLRTSLVPRPHPLRGEGLGLGLFPNPTDPYPLPRVARDGWMGSGHETNCARTQTRRGQGWGVAFFWALLWGQRFCLTLWRPGRSILIENWSQDASQIILWYQFFWKKQSLYLR